MVNRQKVTYDILNNGKYDALLDSVKKALNTDKPTQEQVFNLIESDPYYVIEYKDLNRWGELSSVHIKNLEIKESDAQEVKEIKEKLNKTRKYLIDNEEYEVPSKNLIYMAWTGFVALPTIYVIDNVVRVFTHLYITNPEAVYTSFVVVFILSIIGYKKTVNNHTTQHKRYIQTQKDTRALIKNAIEKNYFTFEEVYQGEKT